MAQDPIYKRKDGSKIELQVPYGVPVKWRIYCRKTGEVLVLEVCARTPYEAWQLASLTQPFSEIECVEVR